VALLEVGKTGAIAAAPVVFGAVLAATSYRTMFVTGGLLVAVAALVTGGVGGRAATPAGGD